jgi:hypothetical protein
MGRGAGNIHIKASLVQWKDIRLWQPKFGPKKKRTILILEISRGFLCIFCRKDQRSCDGWAA